MAVYKIFPYKDSTLYSSNLTTNTGLDAINEVKNYIGIGGNPNVARFLTQFDTSEIANVIDNKIGNNTWDVYFRNFIADSTGLSFSTTLEIYPIAQSWENGTGEFGDSPATTNGVSWTNTDYSGSTSWIPSGSNGTELFTSSFNPTYTSQGGGNWFYSGSGVSSYQISQSFDLRSDKDLNVGVKTIVSSWYSSSIPNYGFIVKFDSGSEFNPSLNIQPTLKYYSVDTNTIYPPQLEFKWRDYTTILSGNESTIVTDPKLKISLSENPSTFYSESINRFRLNVSPLYPTRVFQTISLYTSKNYLPTSSYYAIKDLDTNEYVIDFDSQYTQISADSIGNYFDVYMDGLEPERYYSILIKTTIDGSVKIYGDDYYFKISN